MCTISFMFDNFQIYIYISKTLVFYVTVFIFKICDRVKLKAKSLVNP